MSRLHGSLMLAAPVLAALAAVPALAQTAPAFMTQAPASDWRASKLVGVDVLGTDNQKIGDVEDVLLDATGTAKGVVIGVGGFLGIGQKAIAVPFDAVRWTSQPVPTTAASVSTGTGSSGTGSSGIGMTGNGGATTGTAMTAPAAPGTLPAGPTAMPDNSLGGNTQAAGTGQQGAGQQGSSGAMAGAVPAGGAASAPPTLDYPDHGVLALSREQLQNAPAFRYASEAK